MRAPEHGLQPGRVQVWTPLLRCRRRKQAAAFGHVRAQERLEYGCGFGAPGGDPQALMYDRYAGLHRYLLPHLPRAAGPAPHSVAILTRDCDEAEVAHRGPAGAHVPLDDHHLEVTPGSSQRAGQSDDAGAHDGKVKLFREGRHLAVTKFRYEMRPAPRIPALYAFRKPFSAATFALVPGWTSALDYKIALMIAQVAGYALSKLIGIKVISELDPVKRASAIIVLILLSWAALVLFALIPVPWNVAAMFLNGLPLGMIWGLVFGFMEGRRTSEVLGAVVCASFIVSSGAVKSVGKLLMANWHVSPFWMPAAAGALFLPLLLLSVLALSALPPPNALDEAARVRRAPMGAAARASFLAEYGIGIGLLVTAYVFATTRRP